MRLILHRLPALPGGRDAGYAVGDTYLSIYWNDQWRVTWHGSEEADWWKRNHDLGDLGFARLRETREYLQARLAVDPMPDHLLLEVHDPVPQLTRLKPGEYQIEIDTEYGRLCATLTRCSKWGFGWRMDSAYQGRLHFVSLADVQRRAGLRLLQAYQKRKGIKH